MILFCYLRLLGSLRAQNPPYPPLLSLSLSRFEGERGCVKIISTIVILFIRSGWFPAAYTEQIIAVSTG